MTSGYFPINRRLHREREWEREREREAMSIHETVKRQKWYYIHNMRYAYFPINRRLHWESKWDRERDSELTGYLATSSEIWTHILFLCELHLGHFIWQFGGHKSCSLSWYFIWKFELKPDLDHFIWQVLGHISDLVEHFICKLDLPKWALTTILHITPGKYEPSWLKFQNQCQ